MTSFSLPANRKV